MLKYCHSLGGCSITLIAYSYSLSYCTESMKYGVCVGYSSLVGIARDMQVWSEGKRQSTIVE
jgi:hypothetical protein